MTAVRTSSKGQVVIPVEIRQKLGIKPGQMVNLTLEGDKAIITAIKALRGSIKGKPSLTKALLKERKEERKREEKISSGLLRGTGLDSR